jgi:hypothetical protein
MMQMKNSIYILLCCLCSHATILASGSGAVKQSVTDSLKFYDGQDFTIIGKYHNEKNYVRFPQQYQTKLRKEVWGLGQNAAGISIRFRSNATDISIRWTLKDDNLFSHMAATGIKGVDLYAMVNGAWQFIQTGRPKEKTSEYVMIKNGDPVYREYLLNLPLYDGVDSVSVGINTDAAITKPVEQFLIEKKPVVYYGSSIAQGGCASRPGMAFTNIMERKLDRSIINFGFSGEGKFDSSVAEAMGEIDAALYVVDCNPNTDEPLIYERAVNLVKLLKHTKPTVPVLLVENFPFENSYFVPTAQRTESKKMKDLQRAYATLVQDGIKNLYYQKSAGMIGTDHEGAVDGVHPTDLGMMRIAEFLLPVISKILKK